MLPSSPGPFTIQFQSRNPEELGLPLHSLPPDGVLLEGSKWNIQNRDGLRRSSSEQSLDNAA